MVFNLLVDPFLPVVAKSGTKRWVSFADLAQTDGDVPMEFDWPRPDFNIASYEFCVGVLAVAFQPSNELWQKLWNEPPSRSDLEAALRPLLSAFNLNGDGPRFMQDLEIFDGDKPARLDKLFIDAPGDNALDENKDLLTHRDKLDSLGLSAAAIALYVLQQYASGDGPGKRTSLRGGGPLTCIVLPMGDGHSLWHKVLANLATTDIYTELDSASLPHIFPWLISTLVSDKAHGELGLFEADPKVHPLQAYFGMPRRVRLLFSSEVGFCSLTREQGSLIKSIVQRKHGANYKTWWHPLTPYRRISETSEFISVKPKSGRFGYRDWVEVSYGQTGVNYRLSKNLVASHQRHKFLGDGRHTARLRLAGWVMKKATAESYMLAETPLYLTADAARWNGMAALARKLAKAGDEGHSILRQALRSALFSDGAKTSTDAGLFETARTQFYERTENTFHEILQIASSEEEPDISIHAPAWLKQLSTVVLRIFYEQVPAPAGDQKLGQRSAVAHGRMISAFKGYGASGKNLFTALEIPVPESASKKPKAKEKKT